MGHYLDDPYILHLDLPMAAGEITIDVSDCNSFKAL